MFSYFKNGIKDISPEKIIDIERLIRMIINNPHASKIETIRKMRAEGKDYDKLKKSLPNITPAGIFSRREGESYNQSSGFIYLDIDNIENPGVVKNELIENAGGIISMVCVSCSGKGLSILLRPEGIELSKENYAVVRKYIIDKYFSNYCIDGKVKDVSRAWFISYDPDVYYNRDGFIEIEKSITATIYNPPCRLQAVIPSPNNDFEYKFLHISDVLARLKFETDVEVENRIFDVRPVEYCKVSVPKDYTIPDGQKTSTFVRIIHNLVYLNPGVEPSYIMSYLNYINNCRTETKALLKDWTRLFNRVYNSIIVTGIVEPSTTIKYLHFRKKTISAHQKTLISNRINGLVRKSGSVHMIGLAKQIIVLQGNKATQREVSELINERAKIIGSNGISISTIKKRWNDDETELEREIKRLNNETEITYVPEKITA